jgi:putative FmdB family regulatory protein
MPVYEYTCQSCNKKFDHLARTMSGEHKAKCPECGSPKTARALRKCVRSRPISDE